VTVYTVDYWQPRIVAAIRASYPTLEPSFVRAWNLFESAGQPCACSRGFSGPHTADGLLLGLDGNPREIGLGQLYNAPDGTGDDFTAQGIRPAALRVYCGSATSLATAQQATRALTDAEEAVQVKALLDLVARCKVKADASVARFGLVWPGADYWCLVKAPHAEPGILDPGLPAVAHKLGRSPRDWGEFRRVLAYSPWDNALNACEKLASAVGPVTKAAGLGGGSGGSGLALLLLWLLGRFL
jgi:hypothetical protein